MTVDTTVWLAGLAADEDGEVSDGRAAIVFLHGLSYDRRMWQPVRAALQRIDPGRQAIAVDMPGHGQSPGWPSYDVSTLADGVRRAVTEAGIDAPVLVGHSMQAVVATVYASRYPVAAVVNVDQPLEVEPFAHLIRSIDDQLRGPAFPSAWAMFWESMHTELVPPEYQHLVEIGRAPDQQLILGYWRDVLERDPRELAAWAGARLAEVRARAVPYHVVAGDDLDPAYGAWLASTFPQAAVTILPGTGHFPHLGATDRFTELLAQL